MNMEGHGTIVPPCAPLATPLSFNKPQSEFSKSHFPADIEHLYIDEVPKPRGEQAKGCHLKGTIIN